MMKIDPVPTKLDSEWFKGWWDEITDAAGVDPADQRGQSELQWFTMHCLEDTARQTFEQMNEPQAYAVFQDGIANHRTPDTMVSLMVGWNGEMLGVLEQRLAKFRDLMIQGGRAHGQFRFGMDGLT
jgi:hypothetical protein